MSTPGIWKKVIVYGVSHINVCICHEAKGGVAMSKTICSFITLKCSQTVTLQGVDDPATDESSSEACPPTDGLYVHES